MNLLHQIWSYHGTGLATNLFYAAKVAEAISLIIEYNCKQKFVRELKISKQDRQALESAAAYINDHFNCDISVDQLSHIAFMGRTKFKTLFKQLYGCTVADYITQRRLSHAEGLLTSTDLTVEQISAAIGSGNAGRFASAFRKSTGLFPAEYRKMSQGT